MWCSNVQSTRSSIRPTMLRLLVVAGLGMVTSGISLARVAPADDIDAILTAAADEAEVPAPLLKAICLTESNLDPRDYEHNDGGVGNHAFGLCQVLRGTAERIVGRDPGCKRDFRRPKVLARSAANCNLFNPRVNARAAASYLKYQIKRYKGDLTKAAAAYNAGSVRVCGRSGRVHNKAKKVISVCTPGALLNEFYVHWVDRSLTRILVQGSGENAAKPHAVKGLTGDL